MTTPEEMYGDEYKIDVIQIVTAVEKRGPTSSQKCSRSDKTMPDICARKDTHVNKHSKAVLVHSAITPATHR